MNTFTIFRTISFLEGLSYFFLIFLAMPMKYLYDNPFLVKYIGMIHGILFILFFIALKLFSQNYKINKKVSQDYFLYSLTPFGFLLIELKLKSYEDR